MNSSKNPKANIPNFVSREFWRDPSNVDDDIKAYNNGKLYEYCQPEFYFRATWGQRIALSVMERYAQKYWSILEVGCNTGKVLFALMNAGYKNVSGIEINQHAIDIGRAAFPALKDVPILCSPIEDVVWAIKEVDVIYCCGVYMHLPPALDWVFPVIASKARKLLLTTENETETDFFKWGRNYKDVFEPLGWRQVEEQPGTNFKPLPASSIIRVFTKVE